LGVAFATSKQTNLEKFKMPSIGRFTFADYSDEKSTVEFTYDQATAANFDAIVGHISGALNALEDLTLGNVNKTTFVAQVNDVDLGPAGTPSAQRELKWLLEFQDSVTGGRFQREVPTADIVTAGLLIPNSDVADLTATEWVALKTALDGNIRSNTTGNTATLTGARLVGRNL
jgi:hypothetical protein